jgi:glycosyltransferase involved in cell wall biosynthesis
VEICPNSIEFLDKTISKEERVKLREKYQIPLDKKVFVYGGNLGKPQGIPYLMQCLQAEKDNDKAFFLIVGDGTEFHKLKAFMDENQFSNARLMSKLPKEDYDKMVASCDVGMIFLDYRFTIPNFPSRLLSYMQAGLPVLACTDVNTDVGKVIEENGFGWWCESKNAEDFSALVKKACEMEDSAAFAKNAMEYLKENYLVSKAYQKIMDSI